MVRQDNEKGWKPEIVRATMEWKPRGRRPSGRPSKVRIDMVE